MKNAFVRFVVAMVVALVGLMMPAHEAKASISGAFDYFGFSASYYADEAPESSGRYVSANLAVESYFHTITSVNSRFYTSITDPSEFTGMLWIFGQQSTFINRDNFTLSSNVTVGGVTIGQYAYAEYVHLPLQFNRGSVSLSISPANLQIGDFYYQEIPSGIGYRPYFQFSLIIRGSFGDGPEGDALGLPFVQTPAPGPIALIGLAGIATIRRRR